MQDKEKNLDNDTSKEDFNKRASELLEIGDEEEVDVSETDAEELTDDVDTEDTDENESLDEESIESDDDDEDESEDLEPAKKRSKSESAIVALKRKLKEKEKENKRLKEQRNRRSATSRKEDLIEKYKGQGYDDDTASHMADQEFEILTLKQRADISDFKEEYADLISAYPESKKNIPEILDTMAATGWSAEQVLRGMYYKDSATVSKNKAAVSGMLDSESDQQATGGAVRSSVVPKEKTSLTQKDRATKVLFEEQFKSKISNERFLELKEKFDL